MNQMDQPDKTQTLKVRIFSSFFFLETVSVMVTIDVSHMLHMFHQFSI